MMLTHPVLHSEIFLSKFINIGIISKQSTLRFRDIYIPFQLVFALKLKQAQYLESLHSH